jgi:SEC-C motif domain protein
MSKLSIASGKSAAYCPCSPERLYADCCQPYHSNNNNDKVLAAPTAEHLMRSRYSAYVLGLSDYLLTTWAGETRPASLELEPLQWLRLQVKRSESTGAQTAIVEFTATYRVNGKAHKLHEVSRFRLDQGRWFYIDGDVA